jgi:hypothetical protein
MQTENLSIIHNYDGCSFERHYIDPNIPDGFVLTKEQRYRLQCYYTESGFLADVFDVARFWKLQKFLQPNRCLEAWLRRELQALMQVCFCTKSLSWIFLPFCCYLLVQLFAKMILFFVCFNFFPCL